jgi:thiamine pyrophosphate-dependent acetolactate synthase large subunit-like protein
MVFLGNPEYGVDLHPIDFAKFAEACGGAGYTLENPRDAGDTVERFLNTPGPAVLQAVVDPLEAPLPGKIKAEQAVHFAESLARGEPDAGKIIRTVMKDKIRELV